MGLRACWGLGLSIAFAQETALNLEMADLKDGVSPMGKRPFGLNVRIESPGTRSQNEYYIVDTVMPLISRLWSKESQLPYYPLLCKVPSTQALTRNSIPGVKILRTLYAFQTSMLSGWADAQSEAQIGCVKCTSDPLHEPGVQHFDFPMFHVLQNCHDEESYPLVLTRWGSKNIAFYYEPPVSPLHKWKAEVCDRFLEDERFYGGFRQSQEMGCRPAFLHRANTYDLFLVDSAWAKAELEQLGVRTVAVLPMSIDPGLFRPRPAGDTFKIMKDRVLDYTELFEDRFVIYSGGPLGVYGGQDIMITAFKKFQSTHDDAFLMYDWYNPFPADPTWGIKTICDSPLVPSCPTVGMRMIGVCGRMVDGDQFYEHWLDKHFGVSVADSFEMAPKRDDNYLARALQRADAAAFPFHVAKAATTALAMKSMAVGVPTVISKHPGHAEIVGDGSHAYLVDYLKGESPEAAFSQSQAIVDQVVAALEEIYSQRAQARAKGRQASKFIHAGFAPAGTVGAFGLLLERHGMEAAQDAGAYMNYTAELDAQHRAAAGGVGGMSDAQLAGIGGGVVAVVVLLLLLRLRIDAASRTKHKEWLVAFYTENGVEDKLKDVDVILNHYKGRYDQMIHDVEKKYKSE